MAKLLMGFFSSVYASGQIQLHEVIADDNQTTFTVMCHIGDSEEFQNGCHPMGRHDLILLRNVIDVGEVAAEVASSTPRSLLNKRAIIEDDGMEWNLRGAKIRAKSYNPGETSQATRYLSWRHVAEDLTTPGLPIHIPAEDRFELQPTMHLSQYQYLCEHASTHEFCPADMDELTIMFPGYHITSTAGRGNMTGTHVIGSSTPSRLYDASDAVICHTFTNTIYCHLGSGH